MKGLLLTAAFAASFIVSVTTEVRASAPVLQQPARSITVEFVPMPPVRPVCTRAGEPVPRNLAYGADDGEVSPRFCIFAGRAAGSPA